MSIAKHYCELKIIKRTSDINTFVQRGVDSELVSLIFLELTDNKAHHENLQTTTNLYNVTMQSEKHIRPEYKTIKRENGCNR